MLYVVKRSKRECTQGVVAGLHGPRALFIVCGISGFRAIATPDRHPSISNHLRDRHGRRESKPALIRCGNTRVRSPLQVLGSISFPVCGPRQPAIESGVPFARALASMSGSSGRAAE